MHNEFSGYRLARSAHGVSSRLARRSSLDWCRVREGLEAVAAGWAWKASLHEGWVIARGCVVRACGSADRPGLCGEQACRARRDVWGCFVIGTCMAWCKLESHRGDVFMQELELGRQAIGPGSAERVGESRPASLDSLVLGHVQGIGLVGLLLHFGLACLALGPGSGSGLGSWALSPTKRTTKNNKKDNNDTTKKINMRQLN